MKRRVLIDNIFNSADHFAQNIAFKQNDKSINYESLVINSCKLANFLVELRVKKGDRVALFMNRSFESGYSTYGILCAGAAYVPIDSNLPENRILDIINGCDINVLITTNAFTRKLKTINFKQSKLKTIIGASVDDDQISCFGWEDVFQSKSSKPDIAIEESDLAYIIHTSGTTGKSKGIVHTHYSGYSYAKLSADLYNVTDQDVLANHSHLHFDISTFGYLTMPYCGGTTVIIPEAYTKFPASLSKMIDSEGISIWYSVPIALIQMLQSGVLEERSWESLRWILYGGESFAPHHLEVLFKNAPNALVSNVYGPAEVNQCTYYNFDKNTVLSESIPIGAAWPETWLYLDNAVTEGDTKVGELLVHSSTQMKGYWNNDQLTAAKITKIQNEEGKEIPYYRTGDLVARDTNGRYIFLGRSDRQIKIRGYRVELNGIEHLLHSHNAVLEAAVYAKKEQDTSVIYALIVPNDKTIDILDLKKFLSLHLPNYAIPQEFVIAEEVPRTSAGKIDYKTLAQ